MPFPWSDTGEGADPVINAMAIYGYMPNLQRQKSYRLWSDGTGRIGSRPKYRRGGRWKVRGKWGVHRFRSKAQARRCARRLSAPVRRWRRVKP